MSVFFTSDTHFSHKNIREYCSATRGQFSSLEEMDEFIIAQFNSRVSKFDTVYHLGDFCFGSNTKSVEILKRLNGKIHMCFGNHDGQIKKHNGFKSLLNSFSHDCVELNIKGIKLILSHYPLIDPRIPEKTKPIIERLASTQYDVWLHGHLHGTRKPQNKMFDVGVDTRPDLAPWELYEILSLMK